MSLKQYLADGERLSVLSRMAESKGVKDNHAVAVLGNEAGDLDTFVCSCVLAWHLCWQAGQRGDRGVVAFPMLPFPKSDLQLKTEVLACFEHLDLSLDNFVFAGDNNIDKIPNLDVILVDHNVITTPCLTWLDKRVVEVYDHHEMERHEKGEDLVHCVVTKMGSCATIVAEKVLQERPDIQDSDFFRLIRSTIVLDTENFDPDRQKTTPRDVAIMEKVEKSLGSLKETREGLLCRLMRAKADMSGFTVVMMLRKDMKVVKTGQGDKVSISTLPQTTSFPLVERACIETDLEAVRADLELDCVVVLGNGDMVVFEAGETCSMLIKDAFKGSDDVIYKDTLGRFDRYNRGKSSNRKKILPIVKKAIEP